ncbi:competence/damage-inducible protein A [Stieleria varia]|uniref:Putative competence-damage inducible protein n=1 Tax=Stieleria varia TaxID=2528005 RepID=A0A5C5ZZ35_9BACT|nr:molybdopterin-binding protein [Stieleria varia]TWT91573.1 putative competence-damage inducible protein [Stieleria varia]
MNQSPASPDVKANRIAEVISIGDEMTSGARLDTNGQWLSQRLGELGINVAFHTTVGDTMQHNIDVLRIASERADIVVCTGGLGPTQDDLTRQALADLVGVPLVLSESAMAHIANLFSQRQREMPERNRVQAMFPQGSQEIFNPQGTAPGVDLLVDRSRPTAGHRLGQTLDRAPCRIFALPGVPDEMKRMFDDTVAPRILSDSGSRSHIRHAVMKFFGTGESDMERRLGDMISREREPRVGITVSAATISLRITATGQDIGQCDAAIEATRLEIMELVGEYYFGDGETYEQHHAIDEMLRSRGQRLVTVELGHAAPLADWFASLGPESAFQAGLAISRRGDLSDFMGEGGEAGESTSDEYWLTADRFRRQSGADWLLLVDAYPSLESDDGGPLPAAEVTLTVIGPDGKRYCTETRLGGHPSIVQPRIGKAAMAWMRKVMASENQVA